MARPMHGIDGWELVEYDWDLEKHVGSFIYERYLPGAKVPEVRQWMEAQPLVRARLK